MAKTRVAIIGSGNIGTDLMIKVMRLSDVLEMAVMVGIDPQSDGLARAQRLGVATTAEGVDGLLKMPEFAEVEIVFDATSAAAHKRNSELVLAAGKRMVDLTPAAIGPYVPGYRLKQAVQFEHIGSNRPLRIPEMDGEYAGLKVSVFLEVEGAAHYLPAYAGNLDIMTSAALKTAEKIAARMHEGAAS